MSGQRLRESAAQAQQYRCAEIFALEVITGRWRLPVIWTLAQHQSLRYNDLKRRVSGITNIMLTRSLRSLEEHRLVERREFRQIPPHVEYSLTPKCREVLPALEILHAWGNDLLCAYKARQAEPDSALDSGLDLGSDSPQTQQDSGVFRTGPVSKNARSATNAKICR